MTTPTNSALHMMEGRPSVSLSIGVAISAYGDARASNDGTSLKRFMECIEEIRAEMATLAAPKTALSHFADEVETSGEAEKHAVDAAAVTCKRCHGSGSVEDGQITHHECGIPYENGPVQCMKECPACNGAGKFFAARIAAEQDDRAAMRHDLDKFKALYTAAFEGLVRERGITKELAAALQDLFDFHTKPAGVDVATILDKAKFADVLAGIDKHSEALTDQARAALSKVQQL